MDNISEMSRSYNAWKGMMSDFDEAQERRRVNERMDQISQAFQQGGGNMDAIPMELYSDRDGLAAMGKFTQGMAQNAGWRDQYMKSRTAEAQRSVEAFQTMLGDLQKSIGDQDNNAFDQIVLGGIGAIGAPFQLTKNDDGETFTMTEWGDDGNPRVVDDKVTRMDIFQRVKAMGTDNRKLLTDFTLARIQNDEWNLNQMANGKSKYAVMKNGQVLQLVPQWIRGKDGRNAMGYHVVGGGDVTMADLEANGLTAIADNDPRMMAPGRRGRGYGLGGGYGGGDGGSSNWSAGGTVSSGKTFMLGDNEYEVLPDLLPMSNKNYAKENEVLRKRFADKDGNFDENASYVAETLLSKAGSSTKALKMTRELAVSVGTDAMRRQGVKNPSPETAYQIGLDMLAKKSEAGIIMAASAVYGKKIEGKKAKDNSDGTGEQSAQAKQPAVQMIPDNGTAGGYYDVKPEPTNAELAKMEEAQGNNRKVAAVESAVNMTGSSPAPGVTGLTSSMLDGLSERTLNDVTSALRKNLPAGDKTAAMLPRGKAEDFYNEYWRNAPEKKYGKNAQYWANVYSTFTSIFANPPQAYGFDPFLAERMIKEKGIDLNTLNPKGRYGLVGGVKGMENWEEANGR